MLWWLVYPMLGAVAGLLAGLLGVGGGLVLVAALVALLPLQGVHPEQVMHAALATSLASIVVTALSSARAHAQRGSVMWPSVARLVPGLLVGGAVGGQVAGLLSGDWLRWGVAVFCALAATQLLFGQPRAAADSHEPKSPWLLGAGGLIGAISALVGIGGGSMTVPLLISLGASPVRAVGSSSACGVAIGLASAVSYAWLHPPAGSMPDGSVGYVFLPAALGIALASVLVAPLGARLAHAIGGPWLKRIFAFLLLAVALQLALSG
ncbi:MAG: sulfite exporter TauE/SafE family protein [Xanthomonadales bacterium]|nr:sulfite exporter TauE/SafE family protein [Xanthomonadales bacterium]